MPSVIARLHNCISLYIYMQLSITWPGGCKKGELTVGGQEQARNLGQWLRGRYVDHLAFLPEGYTVSLEPPSACGIAQAA